MYFFMLVLGVALLGKLQQCTAPPLGLSSIGSFSPSAYPTKSEGEIFAEIQELSPEDWQKINDDFE